MPAERPNLYVLATAAALCALAVVMAENNVLKEAARNQQASFAAFMARKANGVLVADAIREETLTAFNDPGGGIICARTKTPIKRGP